MKSPTHTHGFLADGMPAIRTFRAQLAIAVVVYTSLVYGLLYMQAQQLLSESLRGQASSYFDLVYHTRAWNAGYGGVWVLKRPGVETNPYLRDMGIEPDVTLADGQQMTLRNPSLMTRELGRRTRMHLGVSFHLVSPDPVNPENTPDSWEVESLERFERGAAEFTELLDRKANPPTYRYMQPLEVDDTCLGCHKNQGYVAGDIRGAISVNIPLESVDRQMQRTALILLLLTGATLSLGLSLSQWFVSRLGSRLDEANRLLTEMAVTDDLTGLPNRRSVLDRLSEEFARANRTSASLSVIALDIDHFKSVNDRHGHAIGDIVLREIADRMQSSSREYDTIGRIGGEEFLIVAPNSDTAAAAALAERVLQSIRSTPIRARDLHLNITASAGVSSLRPSDERPDDMIGRADDALYGAKAAGRDRTHTHPEL